MLPVLTCQLYVYFFADNVHLLASPGCSRLDDSLECNCVGVLLMWLKWDVEVMGGMVGHHVRAVSNRRTKAGAEYEGKAGYVRRSTLVCCHGIVAPQK